MSSLWFQRTQTNEASDLVQEHSSELAAILAAVCGAVPFLAARYLSFDKILGQGSTFTVNRERYIDYSDTCYYVAVKHVRQSAGRLQQNYDGVVRELRVLTNPNLKNNLYILKLFAYGWTNGFPGPRPYLVVEYSICGSLSEYLKQWSNETEQLALDVALGLKALHDNNIIHGDVKPDNILVFQTQGPCFRIHNRMAKIADFSGAIFDSGDNRMMRYGGTPIYNAPEQEQRGRHNSGTLFAPEQLYQADIFSFGITIWEMMKEGESYIKNEWLLEGETRIEFLNRIHEEEEEPLLRRAEADYTSLIELIPIFSMTLRDEPSKRANMKQIVDVLAYRSSYPRPHNAVYPSLPAPPLQISRSLQSFRKSSTGWDLVPSHDLKAKNIGFRCSGKGYDHSQHAGGGILVIPIKPNSSQSSKSGLTDLDLFQTTLTPHPPWSVQCKISSNWHARTASKDASKRCQASLQLAICYHIGFGVRPDPMLVLHYLTASLEGSNIARMLYHRLITATSIDVKQPNIDVTFMTELDQQLRQHTVQETYFATRVHLQQQLRMKEMRCAMQTADFKRDKKLTLVELVIQQDLDLLSETLNSNMHDETAVSSALLYASRSGSASMVQLICAHCNEFVFDGNLPTPVHWLTMFEESEVVAVANALIGCTSVSLTGPCKGNINSIPRTDSGLLFIAEHCLELFGTPLHWAVRTRNLKLVELLISLGADINARAEVSTTPFIHLYESTLSSLSPLDVAVIYHLPELVERLMDLGAIRESAKDCYRPSAFLFIGRNCIPFSRYIIHGKHYRVALKDTIRALVGKGYSINDTDAEGLDPLRAALSNSDCEAYIIKELLVAGALPSERESQNQETAVEIAISHSLHRRYSVENLRLVLPYSCSEDIFHTGRYSATHMAAVGGSEAMMEVLSTVEGFDVDAKTSDGNNGIHGGYTALHLAAMSGSAEVISLLVRKGANMEILDRRQCTALKLAIIHRKTQAVDVLIELEANVFLENGTVLHAAVAKSLSRGSLVKHLLNTHSCLRKSSVLNGTDNDGLTALYIAAVSQDYEAVETLLAEGANKTGVVWRGIVLSDGFLPPFEFWNQRCK